MMTTTHMQPGVETFPMDKLIVALEEWWNAESSTRENDPFAAPGTLYDVVVSIDSLSVIKALLIIEEQVGFEVSANVIRPGGYRSFEEMIDHLIPAVRDLYNTRHI